MSAKSRSSPSVLSAASLLVVPLLATSLLAQSGPPPIPAELRARFGFEGPLVVKVGDGLGNLQIADTDGDGRLEAIAVDPRRARLVAVSVRGREASLRALPTPGQIGGYTVANVQGDHAPELLLVDARGRLTVRVPGGEAIGAALDLGLPGRGFALLPGDLDGDGRADVVAFGRGAMRQVTGLGGSPKLSPIEPFEENAYSYQLADVDGDGKLDLMAVVPGPNMNLRLRHGRGDGSFGPWRIFSIDELHDVFPARTAGGALALATIAGSNRAVTLRAFAGGDGQQALDWWALGENTTGKTLPWALGDVDGDGDEDLVVARADRAQLVVHEWRDESFHVRTVPTLSGITSIAIGDVDRDGRPDIVITSPEEDAVAWVPGSGPLDEFPKRLAAADKPVAAAVDPAGGVLVLARDDKRDAVLLRCAPEQEAVRLHELGRLPADPVRLLAGDFGDGAGIEVAFVVPGEGLRTVSLDAPKADKPQKADKGKAEVAGFTKKIDDGALGPTRAGEKPALVAVRERFVRTFRVDEKGALEVLAQDNGPDGMVELALAADLGDGVRCYLDKGGKTVNKLARVDRDGRVTTVDVPAFDFTYMVGHRGAALLLSARGVLRVPFTAGASLRVLATHEPPVQRTAYWTGRAGDFDHDGAMDLAVVDRHLPGVQILAGVRAAGDGAAKDELQRALAVPVFEVPPSEQPDAEPRELAVGDLDGDGRTDFVLIAHDRILIYVQEP